MSYYNISELNINVAFISFITIIGLGALFLYKSVLESITNNFMYHPYKANLNEFKRLSKKYNKNEEFLSFDATDGTKLYGMLINYNKKADWKDIIFLYSHGNGAWLGELFSMPQIENLSKYGSVFVYDYRQYGLSEGKINENGSYSDIMGAWNFLTKIKNIDPNKIIVYGHSMGGAVSAQLVATLVKNNKKLPQALILDSTFSSVIDMGNHLLPGLGSLATIKYDNIKNLTIINEKIPVLVFHSPSDETVPYSQSLKIKKKCKCTHITIDGSHNIPIFNDGVYAFIEKSVLSCSEK